MLEPAAEGQRGDDDQHGEYGAGALPTAPARRCGRAPVRARERTPATADTGAPELAAMRARREPREAGCRPVASPAWRLPVGEHGGGGSDAADEDEQPEAEHRGVNRDPG